MPIYDFNCNSCGKSFEDIVNGSTEVVCGDCKSTDVVKVVSAPRSSGVVLKGEGFYKPSQSSW